MPDEKSYESTSVDRDSLLSYARQVAQQTSAPLQSPITYAANNSDRTIEAVGVHWLLDAREHHIEDTAELAVETEHSHYYVVLLPDGSLKPVWVGVEELQLIGRSAGVVAITYERGHRVEDVGDEQIRRFDFTKVGYVNPPRQALS